MHNQRLLFLTLGGLLFFGGNTAVYADPIYYAIATAQVVDQNGDRDLDSTGLVNNSDSAGPVSAEWPGGFASASVTDGALHAFATVNTFGISSDGHAEFLDTLFLTSATLAPGTLVSLLGELDFSATVTPNGLVNPCLESGFALAGIDTQTPLGSAGSLVVQDMTCDNGDINNSTGLIQGIIGEELTVHAFLTAATGGTPEFPSGTVDASNTLRFFLTPIGDFTYSTASGNNYINEAPQVPEPSSLLLFGSVLALAVPRLRRWSSRR